MVKFEPSERSFLPGCIFLGTRLPLGIEEYLAEEGVVPRGGIVAPQYTLRADDLYYDCYLSAYYISQKHYKINFDIYTI